MIALLFAAAGRLAFIAGLALRGFGLILVQGLVIVATVGILLLLGLYGACGALCEWAGARLARVKPKGVIP